MTQLTFSGSLRTQSSIQLRLAKDHVNTFGKRLFSGLWYSRTKKATRRKEEKKSSQPAGVDAVAPVDFQAAVKHKGRLPNCQIGPTRQYSDKSKYLELHAVLRCDNLMSCCIIFFDWMPCRRPRIWAYWPNVPRRPVSMING